LKNDAEVTTNKKEVKTRSSSFYEPNNKKANNNIDEQKSPFSLN
jgi:hypothetical protein